VVPVGKLRLGASEIGWRKRKSLKATLGIWLQSGCFQFHERFGPGPVGGGRKPSRVQDYAVGGEHLSVGSSAKRSAEIKKKFLEL
jgi:hypothetical protein